MRLIVNDINDVLCVDPPRCSFDVSRAASDWLAARLQWYVLVPAVFEIVFFQNTRW